jgi:hypothetical protein
VAGRLGSGVGDASELKDTDFFGCLDFARVIEKGYTPEFRPPISREDATDVSNFDAEFTNERVCIFIA